MKKAITKLAWWTAMLFMMGITTLWYLVYNDTVHQLTGVALIIATMRTVAKGGRKCGYFN